MSSEPLTTIETALKLAGCSAEDSRPNGRIYHALAAATSHKPEQFPSIEKDGSRVYVAPDEVAAWLKLYRPSGTRKMAAKIIYNNPNDKHRLIAMAQRLGCRGPAEVLQWWLDGRIEIDILERPAEPLAYPWKAFDEGDFWIIRNVDTGATKKIGRTGAKRANYYDQAVTEADRRNRSLLIEGD